jgi:hypothetical protein
MAIWCSQTSDNTAPPCRFQSAIAPYAQSPIPMMWQPRMAPIAARSSVGTTWPAAQVRHHQRGKALGEGRLVTRSMPRHRGVVPDWACRHGVKGRQRVLRYTHVNAAAHGRHRKFGPHGRYYPGIGDWFRRSNCLCRCCRCRCRCPCRHPRPSSGSTTLRSPPRPPTRSAGTVNVLECPCRRLNVLAALAIRQLGPCGSAADGTSCSSRAIGPAW